MEKNFSRRSSLRFTDWEQKLQPGTHCSARPSVPTQLFVLIFDTHFSSLLLLHQPRIFFGKFTHRSQQVPPGLTHSNRPNANWTALKSLPGKGMAQEEKINRVKAVAWEKTEKVGLCPKNMNYTTVKSPKKCDFNVSPVCEHFWVYTMKKCTANLVLHYALHPLEQRPG